MTAGFADPEQQTEAEKLARAILTRRRILCERVQAQHIEGGCPNCGV